MNKLEQDIFLAITEYPLHTNLDRARIAAKIALELAEKAFKEGNMRHNDLLDDELKVCFDQFKQEIL